MIGAKSFIGERLAQVREARFMSATSLADLLDLSDSTISSYEHGRQKPPVETVERMASTLNVSVDFFSTQAPKLSSERIFWRSMNYAAKAARTRAKRRYEWLQEIVIYLGENFDFPTLDVPDCNVPVDYRRIDTAQIEEAAQRCREHWGIPSGPCPNLTRLAESKGILVSRGSMDAEGLDAFSQWSDIGRPFVFLGSDKASAVRSRFDAAHELGHLVLHRHVNDAANSSAKDYKLIETQAHRFAAAFLLPAEEFATDLYAPSLDGFRHLKTRWKVAIAAMIMRSSHLGLIDETQVKRMWINMSRRQWRIKEPLDDVFEPEKPALLSQCVEMMVNEKFKTKAQILDDLKISANDIEELCGLERGYFSKPQHEVAPTPRFGEGNIIRFG
jgi:Zn-dependent peptidase ImmA (M78 family)